MQKYKSNITTTSGAAVRNVPVHVLAEDGSPAAIFLDRAGTVPASNPLITAADGTFYFYAVNGRYSLRTTVEGVTITDDDVVLMMDPAEITVAGPIAEAVAAAQAAATAAETTVANSGIPVLVSAAQNAVVDANAALAQAIASSSSAALSKTDADAARDAAVTAKMAAEAALDSFDGRYLGAKAVAPTVDNDGAALLIGALYWDTALPGMRSWNGSAWVTLQAATAAAISNTPAGSIAATTVQSAIDELDAEKAPLSSPALTGTPTAPTAAPGTNTTQLATTEYARAAAIAFGGIKAYATKAEAAIASALLPDGADIEVAQDESLSGARTRYKVQAGALVFVVNLDQVRIDLAASTGAGLVGFARSSGPAQTLQQQLDMLYYGIANVRDTQFAGGAKGDWDGATGTDDTAAFIAAAAAKPFVHVPDGRYKLTAELANSGTSTMYIGAGMNNTELVQTTLTAKIFSFTGQWGGFSDLSMSYAGTPVSGATAVYSTSANLVANRFHIRSCHIGIEVTTGPAQYFSNFFIDNYVHIGIFGHSINDCYFSHFILDAKNLTNGALGGIRLYDKAEAMMFSQGSVLKGVFSITTDAVSYAEGLRPAYSKFNNIFLDSSAQGSIIDKMVESSFSNAWCSGGRSGAGYPGMKLLQTDSITFNAGSNFFNCGGHGLHIASASARTAVNGCYADSNSITAGAGVAHGIYVEANTNDFTLTDNVSRDGLYTGGQQGYGIYIAAGTSARYQVRGNNLAGNSTGPMFDGGTGVLSRVSDNIGYNPVGWGSIAVGASPYTYFSGNTRETIYITGGTVLGVNLPGGAIFGAGSERTIHLEPGEQVSVFYTAPPTMTKFRH